jgi:ABC-type nitrate/sulfonate/bicarbonate transport system permease component
MNAPAVSDRSWPSTGRRLGWLFLPLAGPLCVVLAWYLVTRARLVEPLLLPHPGVVFQRMGYLVSSGSILPDVSATLQRWLAGYALGCAVGIPTGLVIGASAWSFRAVFSLVDFFRSIPVTALFPLFLLLFGIGESSKIAMAFAGTVFVMLLNSAYGVLQATKTRVRAARVFGASRWQVFRHVLFFEALPQTVIGMRTAISLALIAAVLSEMFIGTRHGLGQRVFDAYTVNLTDELYAVLLFTGALGYITNFVFGKLERIVLFWTGK